MTCSFRSCKSVKCPLICLRPSHPARIKTFWPKAALNTEAQVASQLPWSCLTGGFPFSRSVRGKFNVYVCACACFSAYRLRLLHHDLNANFGLLVLVNQAHQLLSVLRPHQHHWTGKGVGFPQLCERGAQKTKKECDVFFSFCCILVFATCNFLIYSFKECGTLTSAAALASSLTSKITAWAPLSNAMRAWRRNTGETTVKKNKQHKTGTFRGNSSTNVIWIMDKACNSTTQRSVIQWTVHVHTENHTGPVSV